MTKDKIVVRRAVSLTLAFSFLVMSLTGIMLYIVPQGKVAYWANWEMFGLSKSQYGEIHITSMFLFIVVTIWHIYFNWRPLVSYLKNSSKQITLFKKELLIALTLNLFFVAGTLAGIQPLQGLLDINEGIKHYWERQYGSPPYGHAEEDSLKTFTQHIGVKSDEALARLKVAGIVVDQESQTLQQIAKANGITAKTIHETIKPEPKADKAKAMSSDVSSLGRRTLQELADIQKIDLEKSLLYLREQGLDATAQSRIRKLADTLDVMPNELYERLKILR